MLSSVHPMDLDTADVPTGPVSDFFISNQSTPDSSKKVLLTTSLAEVIETDYSSRSGESDRRPTIKLPQLFADFSKLEREKERYDFSYDSLDKTDAFLALEQKKTKNSGEELVLDKYGFVVSKDELESASKKSKEQTDKWLSLKENWFALSPDKRLREARKRCRKGIPDSLRGEMWKLITDVSTFKEENPELFEKLNEQTSDVEEQLYKDITRTFPSHIFFKEKGGLGQRALFNTLKAYAIYDKEVGYCQGMGFIAATLLLYMREDDAFYVLIKLVQEWGLGGLFLAGFPLLHEFFFIHERLLEGYLPRLAQHFKGELVQVSMYATEWYNTLFSIPLAFKYVIRIMDVFFAEGKSFLFRLALAILKHLQEQLLKLPFEQIVPKLKHLNLSMGPDELIRAAFDFNITEKKLAKLSKQYADETKTIVH